MYGTILLHEDAGGYVLVAVISFTVAVVITALCIKFRKKGQKSQAAEEFTSGNPDVVSEEETPEIFTNEEQETAGETDEELSVFSSEEVP